MHMSRWNKYGDVGSPQRIKGRRGNGSINEQGYKMVMDQGRQRPEHRVVIERELGRPLLPNENVHHVNGVKTDNQPENLELWVTSQPKGQRVDDIVSWATEILTRYAPERLV